MLATLHDVEGVLASAGKIHLGEERGAVGPGGAFVPAEDVGASGVVIGECVGNGIIGVLITLEQMREVVAAGLDIFSGIENLFVIEGMNFLSVGPFEGSVFADLHETDFAGASARFGIEAALLPDDSLDEGGIEIVFSAGGEDLPIVTMLRASFPP